MKSRSRGWMRGPLSRGGSEARMLPRVPARLPAAGRAGVTVLAARPLPATEERVWAPERLTVPEERLTLEEGREVLLEERETVPEEREALPVERDTLPLLDDLLAVLPLLVRRF